MTGLVGDIASGRDRLVEMMNCGELADTASIER